MGDMSHTHDSAARIAAHDHGRLNTTVTRFLLDSGFARLVCAPPLF